MEKTYKENQFSHRLVEKKRRDRINRCLFDLSLAVPTECFQKSNGKLDKAEILEVTVKFLKELEAERNKSNVGQDDVSGAFNEGYQECMEVVRLYLQTIVGQRLTTRCPMLLQYLQARYSVSCRQFQQDHVLHHDTCPQRASEHSVGACGAATASCEIIPTDFRHGGEATFPCLMELRSVTKRSWDDEFDDFKKSLFRK